MIKTQYGIQESEFSLTPRNLFTVPHKREDLRFGYPAFGVEDYSNNRKEMSKEYSHSEKLPKIKFRPATTSESISAISYDFEKLAKPNILDLRFLQAGYIVRTSEGVFANPPLEEGRPITNEEALKELLDNSKKVNGIYLGENDFGFAPYETFETGQQSSETFSRGGLARVLEHTENWEAENLKNISSLKNYNAVYVLGFNKTSEPILRVFALNSEKINSGLCVYDWEEDYYGYAFGVLDQTIK